MGTKLPYSYRQRGRRFDRSKIPYRARTAQTLVTEILWWRDYYLRNYTRLPRQQKPLELPFRDKRFIHRQLDNSDLSEALKPYSTHLAFERGEEFKRELADGEVVLQAFWLSDGREHWQIYVLQGNFILSVTPEMRGSSSPRPGRSCP